MSVVAGERSAAPTWLFNWFDGATLKVARLAAVSSTPSTSDVVVLPTNRNSLKGLVALPNSEQYVVWRWSDDAGVSWVTGAVENATGAAAALETLAAGDAGVTEVGVAAGSDGVVRLAFALDQGRGGGYATAFRETDGGLRVGPSGPDLSVGLAMGASSDRLLLVTAIADDLRYRITDYGFVTTYAGADLTVSGASQQALALAASPEGWLAAWAERGAGGWSVLARRLALDATPLDSKVQLSPVAGRGEAPSVAYTRGTFAAVWHDTNNGTSRFQLLSEAGQLGAGGVLRASGSDVVYPQVIADGDRFAMVFVRDGTSDLMFASCEVDGGVSAPKPVASRAGEIYRPRLGRGGGGFLVVWQQGSSTPPDIYGARLSGDGTSLDPMGFTVAATTDVEFLPEVAWLGSDWLVAFTDYYDISFTRVSGTSAAAPVRLIPPVPLGRQRTPALSEQPGGVMVAACDTSSGNVTARLVSAWGQGLDAGSALSVAAAPEFACEPAIAGVGDLLFGFSRMEPAVQALGARVRLYTGDPSGAGCTEAWTCSSGSCVEGRCAASGSGGGSGGGAGGGAGGGTSGGPSLRVECGCSAGSWSRLLLPVVLLLRRRRRRR